MRKVAVVLLVLTVLAVAAFAVDWFARGRTETAVAARVTASLTGLRGAEVTIHGTPFLTQLAAGELRDVDVTATAMLVGNLELTDVHATLTGVSTDRPAAATLTATGTATPAALSAAVNGLVFTVEGDQLVATLTNAPLAAVIVPSAAGDAIALEVTELRLGGVAVAPEDLPLGLGDAFTGLQVPVDLPAGLTLGDVTVGDAGLEVAVSGRDVPLTTAS